MAGAAGAAGALLLAAAPALARDLPPGTDPVVAIAFAGCEAALANDAALDESLGWTGHDAGPDAMAFTHWTRGFATREIADAGGLDLTATVAHGTGYTVGTCDVALTEPGRPISAPDLDSAGLVGVVERGDDGGAWSGSWRDPDATLFVRAWVGTDGGAFHLTMLSIVPDAP